MMSDEFDEEFPIERVRSFRASFWWMALYIVVVTNVIAVPLALVLVVLSGAPILTIHLLFAIVGGVAAGELLTFVSVLGLVLWLRTQVGPDGLKGYTFWGRRPCFAWHEIARAHTINLLGLRYMRVYSTKPGAPIWVPLFLADQEGFSLAVRRHTGLEHPLSLALHHEGV